MFIVLLVIVLHFILLLLLKNSLSVNVLFIHNGNKIVVILKWDSEDSFICMRKSIGSWRYKSI